MDRNIYFYILNDSFIPADLEIASSRIRKEILRTYIDGNLIFPSPL